MRIEYGIAVIFAIMAAAFWKEKGSFLFAGYNTMSEKQKKKYDHRKLCRLMSCLSGFCAAIFVVDGIMGEESADMAGLFATIIFIAAVVAVILANTVCKKRK